MCSRALRSSSAHGIRNVAVGSLAGSFCAIASPNPPVTSNHRSSSRVVAADFASRFAVSAR